mgnify:FL=1
MTHKLYETLGISRSASHDEIKKAYRNAAREHHPDKGGDDTKFKEILNAYEVLSDKDKRNQYDQLGDENYQNMSNGGGNGFPGGMNPHDIFAQMFGGMGGMGGFPGNMHFDMNFGNGGGHQPNRKRHDHTHGMNITLQEAYNGTRKNIQLNLQKVCLSCKETCNNCQGRGQITNMVRNGIFTQVITQPCGNCQGTGSMTRGRDKCNECKGRGQYNEEKRIEIEIPAGINSGHQIRINGMGEQKQNNDEIPGDLILQVNINDHPVFVRDGHNLKIIKEISFKESILGKKFTIDHFSGPLEINTLDFGIIEPVKKYELNGKGMPTDNNKKRYGNLIIQFNVVYPTRKFTENDITQLTNTFNSINL